MQRNTSSRPSADVKLKSMNTFHSWLGSIEGLIVLELVRLWGPPCEGIEQLWPLKFLADYSFFYCNPVIYSPQTYVDRVESTYQLHGKIHLCILAHSHKETHTTIHPFPSRPPNFLPAQFFKSLTCILLSFTLPPPLPVFPPPPLSPCGFCHLFTDEWPLHRHDLNVSHPSHYGSLPLFLAPSSCSLPIALPVRLDSSQFFSYFFPPTYIHFEKC